MDDQRNLSALPLAADWTHPRGRAWVVRRDDEMVWKFMCPGCGLVGEVDLDQVQGRVSIDCPNCPFHETLRPKVIAGPMAVAEEDGERG